MIDELIDDLEKHYRPAPFLAGLFIVLLFALTLYRVVDVVHSHNFKELAEAAYGNIIGHPHWRTYQNRLLGPYLILFISKIGISYTFALKLFYLLMLVAQNAVLYLMLKRTTGSYDLTIRYLTYFGFLYLAIQHRFLYPWDCLDLFIFTFFAWIVFQEGLFKYLIALFFVALLNRESALFISLFMIIDAFDFEFHKGARCKISLQSTFKLATGIALTVGGALYTKFIRDYLFVESMLHWVGSDTSHQTFGNHFNLIYNITHLFGHNLTNPKLAATFFYCGLLAWLVWLLNHYKNICFKPLLITFILVISNFFFGWVEETRVFSMVLPFLLFLHLHLCHSLRQ